MRLKLTVFATAAVLVGAPILAGQAVAQDSVYVPLLTYRTGPYAGSGTPIANGMHDYLQMLNERDGGIGGAKIVIDECETGYDTKKGVECWESIKGKKPTVVNPYSTGITLQLIPKAAVDKIPVLAMAYGLSAAADGNNFPWIFNPPLTYWDGASIFIRYVASKEGGMEKLKGKKIGLVHLDAPYGKEPIPVLEDMAKKYGFKLLLYPVPGKEMQNQSSLWLNVRRDRPDWIYLQGWGAMNPTAVKEAAKISFPMDHMIGVWWSGGDDDARPAGEGGKGYSALSFSAAGTNFPVIADIMKYVVDKGKSQVDNKSRVGEALYNRGVYNSMLVAEAIRNAQKITGKKSVVGEDVRRGLETLNITAARLKELGMEGLAAPVKVTCADHSGHHAAYVAKWDGTKYVKNSDWIEPIKEEVQPLIAETSKEYVEKNTGWPKRTETCDKSS
jgi:branched-chain amino acid transport system substrate-binding protein